MSIPIPIDAPKRRKIVQVSAAQSETINRTSSLIVALCDDGTVWYMKDNYRWFALDDVPQPVTISEAKSI